MLQSAEVGDRELRWGLSGRLGHIIIGLSVFHLSPEMRWHREQQTDIYFKERQYSFTCRDRAIGTLASDEGTWSAWMGKCTEKGRNCINDSGE